MPVVIVEKLVESLFVFVKMCAMLRSVRNLICQIFPIVNLFLSLDLFATLIHLVVKTDLNAERKLLAAQIQRLIIIIQMPRWTMDHVCMSQVQNHLPTWKVLWEIPLTYHKRIKTEVPIKTKLLA